MGTAVSKARCTEKISAAMAEAIRAESARILASSEFQSAPRQQAFLQFLVETTGYLNDNDRSSFLVGLLLDNALLGDSSGAANRAAILVRVADSSSAAGMVQGFTNVTQKQLMSFDRDVRAPLPEIR